MKPRQQHLEDRLLRREQGETSRYCALRGLYSDRAWINDLDIVNELGGHSGCVNALSWSPSGQLLASGSDDTHVNLHSYQPESSVSPFSLHTTVSTGHTANIFSVKFMPHSNDSTLVTCGGDAEVRVFDVENMGQANAVSPQNAAPATSGRRQGLHNMYRGVRYLYEGDTNARMYRAHADRVKRIVTESSPYLFLTCSEDGEVRQFDLRLPSSAYPAPRGGRGLLAHRGHHDDSNVPPPLISYKRWNLDLNTISCSASQPHYIALGGAHLHCFLHDRRMLGRDTSYERGSPGLGSIASSMSSMENESMGQATRCVRKFAPKGQQRMKKTENGNITACKISDANPNELIASWSGDHIYSFDLVNSPDASEARSHNGLLFSRQRKKDKKNQYDERNRKRKKDNSSTSTEGIRRTSKSRRPASSSDEESNMALRVRYANGQSEDIAMHDAHSSFQQATVNEARESVLTDSQKRGLRIAEALVRIRKLIFSLDESVRASTEATVYGTPAQSRSFSAALGLAATNIPEMDDVSRSWRYPVDPDESDAALQLTLRSHRDSSRRFVQASGTLARLLGGRIQTPGPGPSPALQIFQHIDPAPNEAANTPRKEIFNYDFLKAIILWLEGGPQALLQGFKRPVTQPKGHPRFPIPDDAQLSEIDDYLIPYLLRIADGSPIPNVDASRFEKDEHRHTFSNSSAAIIAFANAIKMPLEDLSKAITSASRTTEGNDNPRIQDRGPALRFWGFKVGRGILMNAGQGVNFQFVDLAFGGLGAAHADEGRVQEDIDPEQAEDVVDTMRLVKNSKHRRENELGEAAGAGNNDDGSDPGNYATASSARSDAPEDQESRMDIDATGSEEEVVRAQDLRDEIEDRLAEHEERYGGTANIDEGDEDSNSEDEEEDNDDDDDDDDGEITAEERHFLLSSASNRGKLRESVEDNVPCFRSTRQYRGHCNIRTVKDANFFGLHDDYVVSGSDSGHLFIWDKKTSELVNILEGDGEVVNVIQGHPYEPLLAVSGIDHTIKIFSPDQRAQEDARAGINLGTSSSGSSGFSTLQPSTQRPRRRRNQDDDQQSGNQSSTAGLPSRKCMDKQYEIVSNNDADRQGGMREAYITADWQKQRGMLQALAARLQARRAAGGNDDEEGDEGDQPIILGENCQTM